jgi:hypothetical protein
LNLLLKNVLQDSNLFLAKVSHIFWKVGMILMNSTKQFQI